MAVRQVDTPSASMTRKPPGSNMVLAKARKYSSSSTISTVASEHLTAANRGDRFSETCVVMSQGIGKGEGSLRISVSNCWWSSVDKNQRAGSTLHERKK